MLREKPDGRRKAGRLRKRWIDSLEEDLKGIGVGGWRRKTMDREEWKEIVWKAEVLKRL